MDLWTYLKALRRWWWLAIGIPLAGLIAAVVIVPEAPWQTHFSAFIVFPGNPEKSASSRYPASIVLDDLTALMRSDAVAERVQKDLPTELRTNLTADNVADMLSSKRYSREAIVFVRGSSPDEVLAVAKGVEAVLPEVVSTYKVTPESDVGEVKLLNRIDEPVKQTKQRIMVVSGVTGAAAIGGLCLIALLETLRLSYRAKYA